MPVAIGRQMCFVRKDMLVSPVAFIRKVSNKMKYNELNEMTCVRVKHGTCKIEFL
jgi:hypothetical protein